MLPKLLPTPRQPAYTQLASLVRHGWLAVAHIPHGPLLIFENLRSADDRFTADHMPKTKGCCRSVAGRHCC